MRVIAPLVFLCSKGIVFLAPLVYLWQLGSDAYVQIESALAVSLLLWPVFSFGMTSAFAQFSLKDEKRGFARLFSVHFIFAQCAIGIAAVSFPSHVLVIALTSLFLSSYSLSTVKKVNGRPIEAVLYDAFAYGAILLPLLLSGSPIDRTSLIELIALIVALAASAYLLWHGRGEGVSRASLRLVYSFSATAFISGWLSVAAVMIPRAYLGRVVDVDTGADAYFALRISMVLILIYQFFSIFKFVQLYTISAQTLFRVLGMVMLLMAFLVVISIAAATAVGESSWGAYFAFAFFFSSFWIARAVADTWMLREYVFLRYFPWLLVCVLLGAVMLESAATSFSTFAIIVAVMLVAYSSIQFIAIRKNLGK